MSMTSENGFCGEGESGGAGRLAGRLPGCAGDDPAPEAVLASPGGPGGPRADKVAAALTDYLRGRKAKFAPVSAPLSPRAGGQGRLLDDTAVGSSPTVTWRAADAGRKMGEMLAATPRAKGTKGRGRPKKGANRVLAPKTETPRRSAKHSKGGGSKGSRRLPLPGAPLVQSPAVTTQPTLAALGISKRESAEAGRTGAVGVAVAGAPGRVFLADTKPPRGRVFVRNPPRSNASRFLNPCAQDRSDDGA